MAGLRCRARQKQGGVRLALSGLILVLVGLPGLALWGAVTMFQSGQEVDHASRLSDALQEARHAVVTEESLERKYRLEPGPEIRASHRAAGAQMVAALAKA